MLVIGCRDHGVSHVLLEASLSPSQVIEPFALRKESYLAKVFRPSRRVPNHVLHVLPFPCTQDLREEDVERRVCNLCINKILDAAGKVRIAASTAVSAKAQIRNLNHSIYIMTGRMLSDFIVPEEIRQDPGGPESVQGVALEPIDQRPVLVLVLWMKFSGCSFS